MEIKVNFLDNLRLEAKFDDFTVIADQPIRYKGDGSAPGPFDYFLASSALCAAYFVKLYCNTRGIPTENIRLSQNNIVDPENRYQQTFKIQVELPADLLILNPPRAGLDKVVSQTITDQPAETIIYVSCDPATLARDLKRLSDPFEVVDIRCFDLFPQTAHVETVVKLSRRP